jgi:hypothetical protein
MRLTRLCASASICDLHACLVENADRPHVDPTTPAPAPAPRVAVAARADGAPPEAMHRVPHLPAHTPRRVRGLDYVLDSSPAVTTAQRSGPNSRTRTQTRSQCRG